MRRSLLSLALLTLGSLPAGAQPSEPRPYSIRVGPGPEDFDLQRNGPRGPRLIISSQDRRNRKKPAGQLILMDLNGTERDRPRPATILGRDELPELRPVGISLVEKPDQTLLYVIHSGDRDRWIERYVVDGDTLHYDGKLSDPLIATPNDLIALPNGEVYVSNAGLVRNPVSNLFAMLFRRKRGSVVHFDGQHWTSLLPHALFPNGLAVDPTLQYLFINLFGAKRILIYDRTARAFLPHEIQLDAHPDNLLWEIPGERLNVACHRSQWRTGFHIASKRFHAPSVGFRIDPAAAIAGQPAVTPLYDLPRFDASSTALAFDGRVYVSQLIEPFIVVVPEERPQETPP